MNCHSFTVGWQSKLHNDMKIIGNFADANAFFWHLILRDTLISVTLYSAENGHGPLTMIATWSPATGVMRSASHPLAIKVYAPRAMTEA